MVIWNKMMAAKIRFADLDIKIAGLSWMRKVSVLYNSVDGAIIYQEGNTGPFLWKT